MPLHYTTLPPLLLPAPLLTVSKLICLKSMLKHVLHSITFDVFTLMSLGTDWMSSQRGKVPIIYSKPTEQLHTASARLLSASLPLSARLHRQHGTHSHRDHHPQPTHFTVCSLSLSLWGSHWGEWTNTEQVNCAESLLQRSIVRERTKDGRCKWTGATVSVIRLTPHPDPQHAIHSVIRTVYLPFSLFGSDGTEQCVLTSRSRVCLSQRLGLSEASLLCRRFARKPLLRSSVFVLTIPPYGSWANTLHGSVSFLFYSAAAGLPRNECTRKDPVSEGNVGEGQCLQISAEHS